MLYDVRTDQQTQLTESSGRLRLPAPEQPESFAMPADECIPLDIHQRTAPREHATERRHHPTGGIVGSSWFGTSQCEHSTAAFAPALHYFVRQAMFLPLVTSKRA